MKRFLSDVLSGLNSIYRVRGGQVSTDLIDLERGVDLVHDVGPMAERAAHRAVISVTSITLTAPGAAGIVAGSTRIDEALVPAGHDVLNCYVVGWRMQLAGTTASWAESAWGFRLDGQGPAAVQDPDVVVAQVNQADAILPSTGNLTQDFSGVPLSEPANFTPMRVWVENGASAAAIWFLARWTAAGGSNAQAAFFIASAPPGVDPLA